MLDILIGVCLFLWFLDLILKVPMKAAIKRNVLKERDIQNELKSRCLERHPNEIISKLSDTLVDKEMSAVFGENWNELELDYSTVCYKNLLLSTVGKLTEEVFSKGIHIGARKEQAINDIKICQRIEYNLKRCGIKTRLCLEPEVRHQRNPGYNNLIPIYNYNPRGKFMVLEQWQKEGKEDSRSRLWNDSSTDAWMTITD